MIPGRLYIYILAIIASTAVMSGVAFATPNQQGFVEKTKCYQDFVSKLSANLGADQSKVTKALEATKKQMLDEAVKQGKLTKEQADKIATRQNLCWFNVCGRSNKRGLNDGDIAKALGITPEQLKTEYQSGKKLPQIMAEHKLTTEQFRKKMLEIKKEKLSKSVSEGKLTQEKADKILQKIEKLLNNLAGSQ